MTRRRSSLLVDREREGKKGWHETFDGAGDVLLRGDDQTVNIIQKHRLIRMKRKSRDPVPVP